MAAEAWRSALRAQLADACERAFELRWTARALIEETHRLLDENYELRRERARIFDGK
ncbi:MULTISPECIES: hypothetical protein [Streptomyces]|uniref:Uncharacterized protein n=1 Tax=Streptomyces lasiicapitis TaxID=1923961 RepID=A0ABQ2LR47_9ACTN|nr:MULTISPECIES: hypothetical protein [Streptomyces]QIB47589.1 hypothetical protein G3H79_35440 [Streptomyces aureoverticillatus]GGO42320.1 hypothetical protein GCM10012286_23590 [Streptomyces lasiicapitis]